MRNSYTVWLDYKEREHLADLNAHDGIILK
jgi:hypothetical protein